MNENLLAGIVTAVVIAPLCAVCLLGPAALGGALGWTFGWFGGLDPTAAIAAGLVAAFAVYGLARWGRSKAMDRKEVTSQTRQPKEDGTL